MPCATNGAKPIVLAKYDIPPSLAAACGAGLPTPGTKTIGSRRIEGHEWEAVDVHNFAVELILGGVAPRQKREPEARP